MLINYNEKSENFVLDGVPVARVSVRSPNLPALPKINDCYASAAKKFFDFVKEKLFPEAKNDYNNYCENGGRRSKFPTRVHVLRVSVSFEDEGRISFLIESYLLHGVFVRSYHRESAIWNKFSECILPKSSLLPKQKIGEKFDGIYLKNGRVFAFKVAPVSQFLTNYDGFSEGKNPAEMSTLKLREIGKIITEWEIITDVN